MRLGAGGGRSGGGRHAVADGEEATPSLAKLDEKVDRLAELVHKLLPGTGGQETAGDGEGPSPAGRPVTVEEQVAAELDRRDREAKAAAEAVAEKSERQELREAVAKLREKPPEPPIKRSTRLLAW